MPNSRPGVSKTSNTGPGKNRAFPDKTRFRQSAHVLTSRQESITILLCLRSSRYYTLDEVGSIVWDALREGATCEEAAITVRQRTIGAGNRVAEDVASFIEGLATHGLAAPMESARSGSQHEQAVSRHSGERTLKLPSSLACAGVLFAISLLLRSIGIDRTWRLARAGVPRYRAADAPRCFRELAHRVALASTLCPLRSECLEQSLFILWWMRRQSLAAEMYLGAVQYPFKAHAWVESAGEPVNDHRDRLAHYRRFHRNDSELACSPR